MKKFLLTAAVVVFMGTAASAQITYIPELDAPATEEVQDVYKEVKLEDLSEKVQAVVNAFAEKFEVNKLEYNETTKITRVTLAEKETETEDIVLLNEEGEEVKDEE